MQLSIRGYFAEMGFETILLSPSSVSVSFVYGNA